MAAGRFVVPPYFPARNRQNQLLGGALLYVYVNNTTQKAAIYTNEGLSVPSSNPVVANASGQFPSVFAEAGTEADPVLYSVSVTTATGASPGNPFNFNNYRPAVDYETAAVALAESAADSALNSAADAAVSAGEAEAALLEIEDIVANSPDAPSVVNKLNRDGDNSQPSFLTNVGALSREGNNTDLDFFDNLSIAMNPETDAPTFRTALGIALVSPRDYGAVGNGTTDDRQALFDADAAGPTTLTANYRVASNLTFTKPVTFTGVGRLTIDNGVVVTFTSQVQAPDRQIFYGDGGGAGLPVSRAMWWAGDSLNDVAVNARVRLQKAHGCVVNGGTVAYPTGRFYIDGGTAITNNRGQQIVGTGASEICFTTRASNVFTFGTLSGASISGMTILNNQSYWPTSGTAIIVNASGFFSFDNLNIRQAFNGMYCLNSPVIRGSNFNFGECLNTAFFAQTCTDVFLGDYIIAAPVDWWEVEDIVGTYIPGEIVEASGSGAQGDYVGVPAVNTLLRVTTRNINPVPGETITGLTSGATSTLVQQVVPFEFGAIRLLNGVEGFVSSAGDIIGGKFSMTTDGVYVPGQRPAYCKFINTLFDSSDEGVNLNNCVEMEFVNAWFSNRPGKGLTVLQSDGVKLIGGKAINCWQEGVDVYATAKNFTALGFSARSNSTASAGMFAGIQVRATTNLFDISHCIFDEGDIGFGTQKTGCEVVTGTASNYVLRDNLGPVIDNGNPETTTSPAVTASSGTFTTAPVSTLRSQLSNDFLEFTLDIAPPASVGTASGTMLLTMPYAAKWPVTFLGTDLNPLSGEVVQATMGVGSNVLNIKFASGGSAIDAATNISGITGSYRIS